MRSNKQSDLSELHFDRTGLIRLIFLSARHDCANKAFHDWTTELNLRPYKLETILPFQVRW
jgi:hypothetical protein